MRETASEQTGDKRSEAEAFSIAGRVSSFGFAIAGIGFLLRREHNAWIHSVASLLVIGLGVLLPLSALEWCALIFAMAMVWVAEAMNTALELLADVVSPGENPSVGLAKDVAAGGVLVAAIAAAAVGLIVMGPHCLTLLGF